MSDEEGTAEIEEFTTTAGGTAAAPASWTVEAAANVGYEGWANSVVRKFGDSSKIMEESKRLEGKTWSNWASGSFTNKIWTFGRALEISLALCSLPVLENDMVQNLKEGQDEYQFAAHST